MQRRQFVLSGGVWLSLAMGCREEVVYGVDVGRGGVLLGRGDGKSATVGTVEGGGTAGQLRDFPGCTEDIVGQTTDGGHLHDFEVALGDLLLRFESVTFHLLGSDHSHAVLLTPEELQDLREGATVTKMSRAPSGEPEGHTHEVVLRCS